MEKLKKMTNKELKKEFKMYDNLCYGENQCFNVRDIIYLEKLAEELDKRENKITRLGANKNRHINNCCNGHKLAGQDIRNIYETGVTKADKECS